MQNKHEQLFKIFIIIAFSLTAGAALYKAIQEVSWFMCSKRSPFSERMACFKTGGEYWEDEIKVPPIK